MNNIPQHLLEDVATLIRRYYDNRGNKLEETCREVITLVSAYQPEPEPEHETTPEHFWKFVHVGPNGPRIPFQNKFAYPQLFLNRNRIGVSRSTRVNGTNSITVTENDLISIVLAYNGCVDSNVIPGPQFDINEPIAFGDDSASGYYIWQ